MKTQKEIWKDIKGFERLYQISNLGRVKSLPRYKRRKEKILRPSFTNKYLKINLYKNKKLHKKRISRLVAQTFISNPENKPHINHKNGIKTDNRVENLEWCTHSENIKHAYDNNLIVSKRGEERNNSVLTDNEVKQIRKEYIRGKVTQKELANKYNTDHTNISIIVNYKGWKHV